MSGVPQEVVSLIEFDDDGEGPNPPSLYAAEAQVPAGVHRWNGTSWQLMGERFNGSIGSLAVHDPDGEGPLAAAMYVGGGFDLCGAAPTNQVARWNGTSWEDEGEGLPLRFSPGIRELRSMDLDGDGPGPKRLVGVGRFTGNPIQRALAVQGDAGWQMISGGPINHTAHCFERFDPDGPGSRGAEVIVGGETAQLAIGSATVVYAGLGAWDGQNWGAVGSEPHGERGMSGFHWHDADGAGPLPPELYACGVFTLAGGEPADGLARWDGTRWVGMGTPPAQPHAARWVRQLTTFDPDGDGPTLPWLVGMDGNANAPTNDPSHDPLTQPVRLQMPEPGVSSWRGRSTPKSSSRPPLSR